MSFAAITVSAKTYTWTHTVSVASILGSTDSITASMGGKGRMSDTFSSYPTILMVTKYPITKQEPSMIVPVLVMDGNLLP